VKIRIKAGFIGTLLALFSGRLFHSLGKMRVLGTPNPIIKIANHQKIGSVKK
jgi:hypothetical protein